MNESVAGCGFKSDLRKEKFKIFRIEQFTGIRQKNSRSDDAVVVKSAYTAFDWFQVVARVEVSRAISAMQPRHQFGSFRVTQHLSV